LVYGFRTLFAPKFLHARRSEIQLALSTDLDPKTFDARNLGGWTQKAVLDDPAPGCNGFVAIGCFKGAEDKVQRRVAQCVNRNAVTSPSQFPHHRYKDVRWNELYAVIGAALPEGFCVRFLHPCPFVGPIDQELEAAKAQPVITLIGQTSLSA